MLTCDKPETILRLLQRSDGLFEVLAHNPTEKEFKTTIIGSESGPLAGYKKETILKAGQEERLIIEK